MQLLCKPIKFQIYLAMIKSYQGSECTGYHKIYIHMQHLLTAVELKCSPFENSSVNMISTHVDKC